MQDVPWFLGCCGILDELQLTTFDQVPNRGASLLFFIFSRLSSLRFSRMVIHNYTLQSPSDESLLGLFFSQDIVTEITPNYSSVQFHIHFAFFDCSNRKFLETLAEYRFYTVFTSGPITCWTELEINVNIGGDYKLEWKKIWHVNGWYDHLLQTRLLRYN